MPLVSGTVLGSYEIVSPLGAGGMGDVYRARDTRLKRDVALKVLPPEVAADPARRQRFEQEARAAAALNHPNIVAIYDVGEVNETFFIVTELVEGETLRTSELGLRKTLDCAVQIASGLAAAHAAGIVHRDLKPANILLTRDGRIKILDFGLAKMTAAPAARGELATLTVHTEPGMVMGTVGYMSPEQVKGQAADHRSDIFSFGVILYEMLSGQRAFRGDTAVEAMTAILKQDPPDLPDATPSAVRQIVNHCLEKQPDNRFQSARDLSFALAALSGSGSQAGIARVMTSSPRWGRHAIRATTALVLMGIVVAGTKWLWPSADVPSWSGVMLGGPEMALDPRLSPDGHLLAFQAFDRGLTQVAVMKPETGNWSILTKSRDRGTTLSIMWSADGAVIYYDRLTDVPQGVFSVPVLGGEEKLILENARCVEALPDGSLLVVRLNAARQVQLFRFWPDSGRLQDLPIIVAGVFATNFVVRASADGKHVVAYGAVPGRESEGARLSVLDLDAGTSTPLAQAPVSAIGLAGGAVSRDGRFFLTAVRAGSLTRIISIPLSGRSPVQTLFSVANEIWFMDAAADGSVYASLTDRPVEIVRRSTNGDDVERVAGFPVVGGSDIIDVLPDGRTVVTLPRSGKDRLVAVGPGKDPVSLLSTNEETSAPLALLGPHQIALMIGPAPHQVIGLADLTTGRLTSRITTDKGNIESLASSSDGRTLFFAAGRAIWSVPASGGEVRRIRAGDGVVMDPSGLSLVITSPESTKLKLFRVFLDGRPEQEILTDGSVPIMNWPASSGSLHADGRLLVPLMDAWFNRPATLDTATGRITRLPSDDASDYHSMIWLPDGRIMALHVGLRSTLWRFHPDTRPSR